MSIYKQLSKERKALQEAGELPEWITTNSWQLLKSKYLMEGESFKERVESISRQASSYFPGDWEIRSKWNTIFFNLIWSGFLSPSTPIIASMGREKGCPVSCSGGYVGDSVFDFYNGQLEAALLSKNGFGTSGYLGDIRPRGSAITGISGGASGIVPVFRDYVQMSRDISQGSSRRGAWAGYVEIDHDDFYELANHVLKNPDDANVGWVISDNFIDRLDNRDSDAIERYQRALKIKMITGKGYFFFNDKVNNLSPEWYKDREIKASNLC